MKSKLLAIPLEKYTVAVIVGCVLWLLLNIIITVITEKSKNERYIKIWKAVNVFFALFSALAILYMAVFSRKQMSQRLINLKPFSIIKRMSNEKEIKWEKMMNIYVFIPFSLTIGTVLPNKIKRKHLWAAAIGAALSLVIEITQAIFMLGYSELDDFLVNSLGAIIGAVILFIADKSGDRIKKRSMYKS